MTTKSYVLLRVVPIGPPDIAVPAGQHCRDLCSEIVIYAYYWSVAAAAGAAGFDSQRIHTEPHSATTPGALASVTVIGRELATADAYATAAFAMGLAAPD